MPTKKKKAKKKKVARKKLNQKGELLTIIAFALCVTIGSALYFTRGYEDRYVIHPSHKLKAQLYQVKRHESERVEYWNLPIVQQMSLYLLTQSELWPCKIRGKNGLVEVWDADDKEWKRIACRDHRNAYMLFYGANIKPREDVEHPDMQIIIDDFIKTDKSRIPI